MSPINQSAQKHSSNVTPWNAPAPGRGVADPPSPRDALADLVSNYRRPALLADPNGVIIARSSTVRSLDPTGEAPIERVLEEWPHLELEIHTEDGAFTLMVPELASREAPQTVPRTVQLPPRLTKIARLVISGCTDKQISARTGLSFSTVRTYVRQIYRRLNVHSRVELVHATSMGLTIE